MQPSSFKIGSVTIPHRLLMAPMCGITLRPFRKILKSLGAGYVATQMVSAKALTLHDAKTKMLLAYDEAERPLVFQIFGNDADTLAEAARIAQDMGPDILDLNMGCPAKKIVNDGGGSALLKNLGLAQTIFEKMRAVLKIPFTVKMRSGWDKNSTESLEVAKLAEKCGVDAITLHARTREQAYTGKADWDLVRQLKESISIPVIGNGDIKTVTDAQTMLKQTGCDGVMIGREAITRPWFFKNFLEGRDADLPVLDTKNILLKQYEYFFDEFGPLSGLKQMRKHVCSYTRGFRNGAEFRNKIVTATDWTVVKDEIERFFENQI